MSETSGDQLAVAFLFVGRHLLSGAAFEAARLESALTEADTAVLLALKAFPSSPQSAIASVLGRDKTTLSRTVSRLERFGLVQTRIDPIDGRRKTLDLSPAAVSIVAPALQGVTDRLAALLSGLTPQEKTTCLRVIDRIMRELSVV